LNTNSELKINILSSASGNPIQIIIRINGFETGIGIGLVPGRRDFYLFVQIPFHFISKKLSSPFLNPVDFLLLVGSPEIIGNQHFVIR
jgi:hypothetical protein